jgi:phage terminase Nu1 subunit (DNA packaging protein)
MKNDSKYDPIAIPIRGKPLSTQEFAALMDVTSHQIREFINDGMPVYKLGGKGKQHILSSADCISWLRQRKGNGLVGRPPKEIDENDPKSRINAIKVERAEIDLAEKRGDLIHTADLSPFIDDKMVIMRGEFVQIPEEFREEFPEAPPIGRMVRWLNDRITGTLNRLATGLKGVPKEAEAARQ